MLYHLFEYLEQTYSLTGASVFQYISFRSSMAIITSLLISLVFGGKIIKVIKKKQIKEKVRQLGLEGEDAKKGTPTMGGLIILSAILLPTILFAKLNNIYIIIMIFSTIWLGIIGFIDDYIKVYKNNKKGLAGKFKILGQVSLGVVIGCIILFHPGIVIKEKVENEAVPLMDQTIDSSDEYGFELVSKKSLKTTIPFSKNNEFDYYDVVGWISEGVKEYSYILFILLVVFVITAVSNGANMTDGLDGLATGVSAIIGGAIALFAYISGNIIAADYLNIMYIPDIGELVIYMSSFVGACVGFMWYNSYPAQVFMGDTGSLSIGGIIAISALLVRKELLIPILCGVFLIENLSVILQVGYFKYTKKKYGYGKRIFKMAPLHHHFQKLGMHESKIVTRFWIITVMLAVLTIVTLKIR